MNIIDFHTHDLTASNAVISLDVHAVDKFVAEHPDCPISAGIHPWSSGCEIDFEILERVVSLPQVVAIGETGLDKLRGAGMARQIDLFRYHVRLSESLRKPLVIHCVKAWDILVRLKREVKPVCHWGIHGFRGNDVLACQLIKEGFFISLGEYFNNAVPAVLPPEMLLAETDESLLSIDEVVDNIAIYAPPDWSPGLSLYNFFS